MIARLRLAIDAWRHPGEGETMRQYRRYQERLRERPAFRRMAEPNQVVDVDTTPSVDADYPRPRLADPLDVQVDDDDGDPDGDARFAEYQEGRYWSAMENRGR